MQGHPSYRHEAPRDEDTPKKTWWTQRRLEITITVVLLLAVVVFIVFIPGAFNFLLNFASNVGWGLFDVGKGFIQVVIWLAVGLPLITLTFLGPFLVSFIGFIKINEKDKAVDPEHQIGGVKKIFYFGLLALVVVIFIAVWVPLSVKLPQFPWFNPSMYTGLMNLLHLDGLDTNFAPGWGIYGFVLTTIGFLWGKNNTWETFKEKWRAFKEENNF